MNNPSVPKLTWLDQLRTDHPPTRLDHLWGLDVVTSACDALSEPVVEWALATAGNVADEVDELRRSESIATWGGTRKLERLACTAGVLTTLVSLRSGSPVSQAPEAMLRQVRAAFHQGADLSSVIRFVWSHHARFQERLLLAQRELAPVEDNGAALQDLHARMHQILDSYISAVDGEFRREKDRWKGGSPAQRRALIEEIIAGETHPQDVERRLGIHLSGQYLFTLIGSVNGVFDESHHERLRLLREKVGNQIGATGGFSQNLNDDVVLWCLTFPSSPVSGKENPLKPVRFPAEIQVGVGPIAQEMGDLARAVRGAAEAYRVSAHPARPETERATADLVFHDDIRMLSILTRSEVELADFTDRTLGDLAQNTPKNADLRRTLLTYLLHSRSRKEAAKDLHISPNTVAYRVDQAREITGNDFHETSLEILVALHVLDILPGIATSENR